MTPGPATGYCHPCRAQRRFRFAGWAADGSEAVDGKPRALHRTCAICGHSVLTLGNVHDSEGLCVTIARKRIVEVGGVELEDAVAFLYWHVWRLYLAWLPVRLTFLSYASHWLPARLDSFVADATGEAGARRKNAKPQARSVSWDALTEEGAADQLAGSGLRLAVDGDTSDVDDDRSSDLRWLLGLGDREGARREAV